MAEGTERPGRTPALRSGGPWWEKEEEATDSQTSFILGANVFTMNNFSRFWISTKAGEMVSVSRAEILNHGVHG